MMGAFRHNGPAALLIAVLCLASCAQVPGLGVPEESGQPRTGRASRFEEEAAPSAADSTEEGEMSGRSAEQAPPSGKQGGDPGQFGPDFLDDSGKEGDRVLAVVNSEPIRASDLFQTFFLNDPLTTLQVLENEILFVLVRKEAARLGITVHARDVEAVLDKAIENERARFAAYVDEAIPLEQFVRGQLGMSFDEFLSVKRRTVVFNLLLDRCVRFTEITRKRIKLGLIVLDDLDEARKIHDKLQRGASFEVTAKDHSLHPSAEQGGMLPMLPVDEKHPFYPLVQGALDLEKGGLSEVEATPYYGKTVYRIVRLYDVVDPLTGDYAALAPAVAGSLKEEPIDLPAIKFWQQSLLERYDVKLEIP